jgi:hypothetical protein
MFFVTVEKYFIWTGFRTGTRTCSGTRQEKRRTDNDLMRQYRYWANSGHQAARLIRVSISLRSAIKSIGLVNNASAPFSSALRFVSASP